MPDNAQEDTGAMRSLFFPNRAAWIQITFAFSWFGILLVIAGFTITGYSAYWNSTALRTHATIVDTRHDKVGNKRLVVRYADNSGTQHEATINASAPAPRTSTTDQLPILYHPREPKSVRIDRFMDKWFMGGFMTIWGAFLWWILRTISKRLSINTNEAA